MFTVNELMAYRLSQELRNDEMGFVGVGSSGRAFVFAVGLPMVASRLAQLTHAPHFSVQMGPLIDPILEPLPSRWFDSIAYDRDAPAFIDAVDNLDALQRGRVDISFISGAQIDAYGNVNVTRVTRPDGSHAHLVGALALPEHQAFAQRAIVLADLSKRTFVEQVDFVSGVGRRSKGKRRDELGLPGGGPVLVMTDRAVFDFSPETDRMRLLELYPGQSVDSVLAAMSFTPEIADNLTALDAPPAEVVALIRDRIDPEKVFLGVEP
jgi:glutaconate CoA-transferase subunit B